MTVKGGHWILFKEIIEVSKAEVMLNATVLGLRKVDWVDGLYSISSGRQPNLDFQEFNSVILAAPYQFAGLDIKGDRLDYMYVPDEFKYVSVHVTLFKSRCKLTSAYFDLS